MNKSMSSIEVGERLRLAREGVGLSQAKAAESLGAARTTLVAIEQGQRKIKITELQQLARAYKTTVNSILRAEAIQVDLVPRFRKLVGASDDAAEKAVRLLTDL